MPKQLRGTLFTSKKQTLTKRFADVQRIKNVARNTTGDGVNINLDGSAVIFSPRNRRR